MRPTWIYVPWDDIWQKIHVPWDMQLNTQLCSLTPPAFPHLAASEFTAAFFSNGVSQQYIE